MAWAIIATPILLAVVLVACVWFLIGKPMADNAKMRYLMDHPDTDENVPSFNMPDEHYIMQELEEDIGFLVQQTFSYRKRV